MEKTLEVSCNAEVVEEPIIDLLDFFFNFSNRAAEEPREEKITTKVAINQEETVQGTICDCTEIIYSVSTKKKDPVGQLCLF